MKNPKPKDGGEQLKRVRGLCSVLPGTTEKLSHGAPTFFLKQGVYAMFVDNHHQDGHVAIWIPSEPGEQEALIATSAKKYYRPPYVGVKGWVGVELDQVDDEELGFHILQAHRLTAAKKPKRK